MIVEKSLPKIPASLPLEEMARSLFQGFHKAREIALGLETLNEKMDVVGHYAVGVNRESVLDGFFAENFKEPMTSRRILEDRDAAQAAERDKEPAAADVIVMRETNAFAFDGHG